MAMQQLNWEPTHAGIIPLSDAMLAVIKKRLLARDYKITLTEKHISYLEGVADAGIADATALMAAIKEHKEIDLTIIDLEP